MGKGLALQFKNKYPLMFQEYKRICLEDGMHINHPILCTIYNPWIVNFPTKNHWANPSDISWIKAGLINLVEKIETNEWAIESIAIPPLGCGLGGLDENEVYCIILDSFKNLDIPVELYGFNL
jgi:O-acetyl-ADP-ribose deacetylase (regulator of RNase III)